VLHDLGHPCADSRAKLFGELVGEGLGGTRCHEEQAAQSQGVDLVRQQTDSLSGISRINDSGVRILHSARALRKVAVGK